MLLPAYDSTHKSCFRRDLENMRHSSWRDIVVGALAAPHNGRRSLERRCGTDQRLHASVRGKRSYVRCPSAQVDNQMATQSERGAFLCLEQPTQPKTVRVDRTSIRVRAPGGLLSRTRTIERSL